MQPIPEFNGKDRRFWAHVRLLSEALGYSKDKQFRSYSFYDCFQYLRSRGLQTEHFRSGEKPSDFGKSVVDYLNARSEALAKTDGLLMDRDQAKAEFEKLSCNGSWACDLPMNKQKGEKRHYAYLTCIVNMLTQCALDGKGFDSAPRGLITVSDNGVPLRTLSRWMDGAYPSINDPVAIWEVKEYYGTTTFGSRVADGVYETMLDGEELAELADHEKRKILHYLIVDDHFTWWDCGKSYLCRLFDMMHMRLVDEVLIGREVLTRWPLIVKGWLKR